ncbi:MAG TPA: hypothetical protein VFJ43_01395, partial [Bacteroidia bacterium]|nr:hypothetical protein [Bacteroidia bacterium]
VLAAEEVLRSRNISWIKSEMEKDEVEVLTIEELREQIATRLSNGEKIEAIRDDLKRNGVDVMEYAELDQEKAAEEDPSFGSRRVKAGAISSSIVFVCIMIMRQINIEHNSTFFGLMIGMGAFIVAITVLVQKKS